MGRMAFGVGDAFSSVDRGEIIFKGTAAALGGYGDPSRPINAVNDLPRVVWMNKTGQWSPVGTSPDNYVVFIDVKETSASTVGVSMGTFGHPKTGPELAHVMESLLNSSALTLAYTVTYDPILGRFTISATGGTFQVLWKTGTHGSDNWTAETAYRNLGPWLGFDTDFDSGIGTAVTSEEERFDTELSVGMHIRDATISANVWATVLQSASAEAGAGVDFSDVKIYGHASDLGINRRKWEADAAVNLTFSARSEDPTAAQPTNKLQIAYAANAATVDKEFWFISWRYFDATKGHAMGLLKALDIVESSTRQITQLSGHGLEDPTTPLGVDTYYPVQNMLRWKAPLNFNSWGAADYRTVVQGAVKAGRSKGLLWALRWDEIVDGTYDADDEAARGFLLWASIHDYSDDDYSGAGTNEFISGEITIEQVR